MRFHWKSCFEFPRHSLLTGVFSTCLLQAWCDHFKQEIQHVSPTYMQTLTFQLPISLGCLWISKGFLPEPLFTAGGTDFLPPRELITVCTLEDQHGTVEPKKINHEKKGTWSEPNLQGIMFQPLIFRGVYNLQSNSQDFLGNFETPKEKSIWNLKSESTPGFGHLRIHCIYTAEN